MHGGGGGTQIPQGQHTREQSDFKSLVQHFHNKEIRLKISTRCKEVFYLFIYLISNQNLQLFYKLMC
jgi:hypothetical protein